jgi:hypothetical protein
MNPEDAMKLLDLMMDARDAVSSCDESELETASAERQARHEKLTGDDLKALKTAEDLYIIKALKAAKKRRELNQAPSPARLSARDIETHVNTQLDTLRTRIRQDSMLAETFKRPGAFIDTLKPFFIEAARTAVLLKNPAPTLDELLKHVNAQGADAFLRMNGSGSYSLDAKLMFMLRFFGRTNHIVPPTMDSTQTYVALNSTNGYVQMLFELDQPTLRPDEWRAALKKQYMGKDAKGLAACIGKYHQEWREKRGNCVYCWCMV